MHVFVHGPIVPLLLYHVRTRRGLKMDISKKGLGMPPTMRLLVLAMTARRHEEHVSAGARVLEMKRAASVAGGDVFVVSAVNMKV